MKPFARGKTAPGRQGSTSATQTPSSAMVAPTLIFPAISGTLVASTGTKSNPSWRKKRGDSRMGRLRTTPVRRMSRPWNSGLMPGSPRGSVRIVRAETLVAGWSVTGKGADFRQTARTRLMR